jgi:hypothetical protein
MLKEYQTHSELNPDIWIDGDLKPELQEGFMKIAQKFYDFLETNASMYDVILIGSNANYNWTKYSDIDLHVIINYMEVGDNMHLVKNYLHAKKSVWNQNFPLKYKGMNIELYAQDSNDDLHSSVGIYSVGHKKWIRKPKADLISIDDSTIEQKAAPYEYEINKLKEDDPRLEQKIKDILFRLRHLRQVGLEAEGEYSLENLAFKHLRNKGLIERLKSLLHFDSMRDLQVENAVRPTNSVAEALVLHITKQKVLDPAGWDNVMQQTGGVADAMGQWKHPGKCTMIPSNQITMQNVPHKVLGIDDTGHMQLMHPEQQYTYPGKHVFEIPLTGQQKTLAMYLMNGLRNAKSF